MKSTVVKLCALVLTISPVAHAKSKLTNLDGTWTLIERVCTDNQPSNDRFILGRDKLEFMISGNRLKTTMVVDNEITTGSGHFSVLKNTITTISDSGQTSTIGYSVSKQDELVIISAGFGQGGTCNEGQALLSIFKK